MACFSVNAAEDGPVTVDANRAGVLIAANDVGRMRDEMGRGGMMAIRWPCCSLVCVSEGHRDAAEGVQVS